MFSGDEYVKEYEKKCKFEDQYYKEKKVDESIIEKFNEKTKMIIDARDSEYIWCKAEVIAAIESKEKENSILVHYQGWGKKYDEVLPINSVRIAKSGFYTSRTDIPYYQDTDNKAKKPVVNMPNSTEKIDIIEELKKDCLRDSDNSENSSKLDEQEEEPLNEEEVYEYLMDKVSSNGRGYNRDLRSLNTQTTSLVHLPSGTRGGDVRIRVNALGFNRLRSVFNRSHF